MASASFDHRSKDRADPASRFSFRPRSHHVKINNNSVRGFILAISSPNARLTAGVDISLERTSRITMAERHRPPPHVDNHLDISFFLKVNTTFNT
jgi:hypothetical protein